MQIRYKLLLAIGVYWTAFALLTLSAARQPGLVRDPWQWTYPWAGVLVVWVILAAMLAGLYLVLWPKTSAHVARRTKWGFVYSAALAILGLFSVSTDMPGHVDVPMYASLLLFLIPLGAGAMVRDGRDNNE